VRVRVRVRVCVMLQLRKFDPLLNSGETDELCGQRSRRQHDVTISCAKHLIVTS